jgi:glutamate racemase
MASIGVFDSGVGGLTVLRALKARWPAENFIYLADTARLPYGNKSLHTVHNYVGQCLKFFKAYDLKAVVVACNTASAAIIEQPVKSELPVFNVIGPGARKALEVSASGRIGVLATRATVHAEAYPHALRRLKDDVQVFQQPCPLWVPLVEEGWIDDPVTNIIVDRYVSAIMRHQVDTLIMGCTHYPVLREAIAKACGPAISLVDSSQGLIEDLSKEISMIEGAGAGKLQILATDFSPRLEETARLLLRGTPFDSIEPVDL